MSEPRRSTMVQPEAGAPERRCGVDRRSGHDRRAVDLWRQIGRPGFDLRAGAERRSGRDRRQNDPRHSTERHVVSMPDVVMPWQIAETVCS